jgi:DNA recombination protein RmuC
MDKVGQSLDRTRTVFADARNQLAGGRGSVVRQVEMLKDLGAKTNKQIPPSWTEHSDVVPIANIRAS